MAGADDRPVTGDLSGRVAVVTGAGGGLGRAASVALARAGARVVAVGRRPAPLEETLRAVEAAGGEGVAVAADVRSAEEIERALDAAPCDILVTCAGVQLRKLALEISEAEWDELMAVNLRAVFFCCQRAALRMRESGRGGAIVNVTSLTEQIGLPRLSAYGASKGGVAQLTRALAVELAPDGIRVNAVAPGRVATPMTEDVFAQSDVRLSFLERIPLARAGDAGEIAAAIVFLASPAASYVTGATLVVDGGWLAGGGAPLG